MLRYSKHDCTKEITPAIKLMELENRIAALTADKDEQARKTRQLEEGLKRLRSSLQWLKETIPNLDYKAWAEDNIGKIDALLGGKEDES